MNARFWIWHHEDWVKVTLKLGQKIELRYGSRTDEGFFCMVETYEHTGEGLVSTSTEWGRDCDGPYERRYDHYAAIRELKHNNGRPKWQRTSSSQRDIYAEAMGY